MKRIAYLLIFITLSLPAYSEKVYSNMKQPNEYSCGPVSSANTIINLLNVESTNIVEELTKLQKTTTSGTTINNLCKGIDKFCNKYNKPINISYYGIINVDKKYQKSNIIRPNTIKGSGIVNIGFYKKTGNVCIREEGHYVSLIKMDNNKLVILDPYNKNKGVETLEFEKQKLIVINKDKFETFSNSTDYYFITTPIDYLKKDECAIINGIIILN